LNIKKQNFQILNGYYFYNMILIGCDNSQLYIEKKMFRVKKQQHFLFWIGKIFRNGFFALNFAQTVSVTKPSYLGFTTLLAT